MVRGGWCWTGAWFPAAIHGLMASHVSTRHRMYRTVSAFSRRLSGVQYRPLNATGEGPVRTAGLSPSMASDFRPAATRAAEKQASVGDPSPPPPPPPPPAAPRMFIGRDRTRGASELLWTRPSTGHDRDDRTDGYEDQALRRPFGGIHHLRRCPRNKCHHCRCHRCHCLKTVYGVFFNFGFWRKIY